jgi:putative hemolysin
MMIIILVPFLILLIIIIQGFFSNSEMAMVSANRIRLNHLSNSGNKNASIILKFLNEPEQIFGITLIGINVALVLSSILINKYLKYIIGTFYPDMERLISIELVSIIILDPLTVIFGELFPMSLGRKYPNTTCLRNAKMIYGSYILFFPLTYIIKKISRFICFLLRIKSSEFTRISRSELELLVAGKISHVSDGTRKIIKDTFDIKELIARDVMIHLNEVEAVNENTIVGELKEYISQTNFSRFPVYRENIFNIIATIHAVSILGVDDDQSIMQYTEKLYIIPSTKPVVQILSDLKRNRKYMGIVVDEYGAVCGILTIENIAEELIGDIKSEEDLLEHGKVLESGNIFEAKMTLDDFFDLTGIDLTDEDAETLGGIMNLALGRIGRTGEKVFYRNMEFEIVESTDRLVKKIRLLSHISEDWKDK